MSSERGSTASPEIEAVAVGTEQREAEQLATDLQRLRDLLEQNRIGAAREFIRVLEQRWPESERVQHYARVLAPPVVRSRPDIPARSSKREWKWIEEHAHEYPGCWLAIYEDRLIAAHPDRREVVRKAREVMGEVGVFLFHQREVSQKP